MSIRPKRKLGEKGLDDWLMTYADMITLLLCFFAVLLAISIPKQGKFEQARQKVSEQFASRDFLRHKMVTREVYEVQPVRRGLMNGMQSIIDMNGIQSEAMIKENDGVYRIELNSIPFFSGNSADLSEEGSWLLTEIVQKLKQKAFDDYIITIEGHTGEQLINPERFPSNWELSTARAVAVLLFFLQQGIPAEKLSASGYADTFPKFPNRNKKGEVIAENQKKNQRIIIVLKRKEG